MSGNKFISRDVDNRLIVNQIDPYYGEIERPATLVESLIFRAKDILGQLIKKVQ